MLNCCRAQTPRLRPSVGEYLGPSPTHNPTSPQLHCRLLSGGFHPEQAVAQQRGTLHRCLYESAQPVHRVRADARGQRVRPAEKSEKRGDAFVLCVGGVA